MSADAKLWMEGSGNLWAGLHDGECHATIPHHQPDRLSQTIRDIEHCMGTTLRWEVRAYPDGQFGLVGYVV